jgi:hypothetical protein
LAGIVVLGCRGGSQQQAGEQSDGGGTDHVSSPGSCYGGVLG